MVKGLNKVFKDVVRKLKKSLPTLGGSGSEVSHFITESSNFTEVTRLPAYVQKAWLKSTFKEINNLIKIRHF